MKIFYDTNNRLDKRMTGMGKNMFIGVVMKATPLI